MRDPRLPKAQACLTLVVPPFLWLHGGSDEHQNRIHLQGQWRQISATAPMETLEGCLFLLTDCLLLLCFHRLIDYYLGMALRKNDSKQCEYG